MPRCLLWKRVPGYTIPMAPMNLVEQIRALITYTGRLENDVNDRLRRHISSPVAFIRLYKTAEGRLRLA
jgi:hypothetical protein